MNDAHEELAERLLECFAPLNDAITAEILAGMCEEDSFTASYRFDIPAPTIRQLTCTLAREQSLWRDFHDLMETNRNSSGRSILMQQALIVGRWQRQRD